MTLRVLAAVLLLVAAPAGAAPTRSSPLTVTADAVFVVNPDSSSVSRVAIDGAHGVTLTQEASVGRYPRTVALAGAWVFTADQTGDTVSRRDQADLGNLRQVEVGTGCAPYGIAAVPGGDTIVVTCEGTGELLLLDATPSIVARVALHRPDARAVAVSADGARAYVTHFLTREPDAAAHVSVVDLAQRAVSADLAIDADRGSCETLGSGRGVLNLVGTIALVPDGAPAGVAGQLWIGGTVQNNLDKGLFARAPGFATDPRARLFPLAFAPIPPTASGRDVFKAARHDIARGAIYKLDATTGAVLGRIDLDGTGTVSDIEIATDGTVAYAVDAMTNSYHVFGARRGQGGDPATIFGAPSAFGAFGADPGHACTGDAGATTPEAPYRTAPEARLRPTGGYDPLDRAHVAVATGTDFDTPYYWATGRSRMRAVPDGVGTGPSGVRVAADGGAAFVTNYLARNVVAVATDATDFACAGDPATACTTVGDCAPAAADCVPFVLAPPAPTIIGTDPLPASLLDGKILFATAARDASVANGTGLATAAPPFDDATRPENRDGAGPVPGSVVSTARDGASVTCASCHADFGGHDGRTWDFAQLGVSLRNTMDLRGRAAFAPGTCAQQPSVTCFFDATCGDTDVCRMKPELVPPTVPAADRDRYFNPMLTVHWNGDRDEVEDFEHTFRSLQGAGDCDGNEDTAVCQGALVQRDVATASERPDTPTGDVNDDLGAPNRNLRGPSGRIVGIRLTHVADFVYSLTEFVRNPNSASDATARGRLVFQDPQTGCATCHSGGPPGVQLFTDKRPRAQVEQPDAPGRGDGNNPFLRHDVGTANVFDQTDPGPIAQAASAFQNDRIPVPGSRGALAQYVTPVLNDVWNTAPFLHDGSAPTLLDVVRPCARAVDDCDVVGRGRNVDDQHGHTSFLTPRQLNDLVAFQKSLTTATAADVGAPLLRIGVLTLSRATLRFAKSGKAAKPRARDAFDVAGRLFGAPQPVDPGAGVTFSLAAPAGEEMTGLEPTVVMRRHGRAFAGRARVNGGTVSVTLRRAAAGAWRAVVKGRRLDLAAVHTGNADVTVAFEIAGTQFVQTRTLVATRRGLRLRQSTR